MSGMTRKRLLAEPLRCNKDGKLSAFGQYLVAFCDKADVSQPECKVPRKCRTIVAGDVLELQSSISFLHECAIVAGWWFTACGTWLIARKAWRYCRRLRVRIDRERSYQLVPCNLWLRQHIWCNCGRKQCRFACLTSMACQGHAAQAVIDMMLILATTMAQCTTQGGKCCCQGASSCSV